MPIGEPHTLRGQPIDPRRSNLPALRIVAPHITVAEIISVDDDDVRLIGGPGIERHGDHRHRKEAEEDAQTGRAR